MKLLAVFLIACGAVLTGCGSSNTVAGPDETTSINAADTARTSLDWNGIYKGTVPCADCEGTDVFLELKHDGTYMQSLSYIGKMSATVMDEGEISWNAAGNEITIKEMRYFVAENRLVLVNDDSATEQKVYTLYKEPAL